MKLCKPTMPSSLSTLAVIATLALGAAAHARTINITAAFTYTDPDGHTKPCRWCWVELIDYDPLNDDVLTSGYTDGNGRITLGYDSEKWDGIGGGRVDPFMRCYTRLEMPKLGATGRWENGWVVKKRRVSITQLQRAYHELNTGRYDNNNSDRTTSANATGETGRAFFLLDSMARANTKWSDGMHTAPAAAMALDGEVCTLKAQAVYPATLSTQYSTLGEELLISDDRDSFNDFVHEYGHWEMAHAYGGAWGDYDCTQSTHSFSSALADHWYNIGDARWTAFCEAWADFCPVITSRVPIYAGCDVEKPDLASAADRCEGVICRIFWDLSDSYRDQVAAPNTSGSYEAVARPTFAGVQLDDDPFGFAPGFAGPARGNLWQVKDVLCAHHPKSLSAFRTACRADWAEDALSLRALDAVLWANGYRSGITDTAPTCTLTVTGPTCQTAINGATRTAYNGDLTLTADVQDADAQDAGLQHVSFYCAAISPGSGRLYDRDQWVPIAVDVNGSDGFQCTWPKSKWPANLNQTFCLVAVASDFFAESPFTLTPNSLSTGQQGPLYLTRSAGGGTAGGGTTGGTTGGGTTGGGTTGGTNSGLTASNYSAQGAAGIVGWDWLRSDGASATWTFDTANWPTGSGYLKLVFDGLITNQATGGAGYSSTLSFVLTLANGQTRTVSVPALNPYKPINPNLTNGTGYAVHGLSTSILKTFREAAVGAGPMTVTLTWPAGVSNHYHVAVKQPSVSFQWTPTGTGGTGGYQRK